MTESTHRWRGHTHEELYLLLHDGPGAAASAEPSRRWQEISTNLSEIGQDLGKALEQSGAHWTGKAAGRAYDRLSITATWATETSTSAARMRTAVEDQAEHVAKARADMPPPEDTPAAEPDPALAPAMQVAMVQTDLEAPEAAASAAEERAFEVMAVYERNTNATTAAMATLDAPPELVQRDEIHHGAGITRHETRPASITAASLVAHHHGGDRWQPAPSSGSTTGSAAPHVEQPPARGPAPAPTTARPAAPGSFSGAAMIPPRRSKKDDRSRLPRRPAAGSAPAPRVGATGLPATDMQAVAASQAATSAQHTAPPTAGAPVGGQQDKLVLRRFGTEAIGSSQWFGDGDEQVVGQSPRRRWELRESGEVTESVSVLGEEHKLPPTVIGDGPTTR